MKPDKNKSKPVRRPPSEPDPNQPPSPTARDLSTADTMPPSYSPPPKPAPPPAPPSGSLPANFPGYHLLGELGIVGSNGPALAEGRHVLVGLEAIARGFARPADGLALVARAHGVGRVVNHGNAGLAGDGVADRPQAHHHRFGSGEHERATQAVDALSVADLADARVAAGQRDELGSPEVEA